MSRRWIALSLYVVALVGITLTSDGWGGDRWRFGNRLSWMVLGIANGVMVVG